ncbi:hypothetical protein Tco_1304392 [Tanacetum coccineum]
MDLLDDNLYEDDDDARYGVFMYNKSTATPNSTYLSLTVTSSSLYFIQTLLDETPTNELTDFMIHPVYIDAQTTSMVHNPEGHPDLTSYILGASEVPIGTHVGVLATKTLLQEMFPNENAHHLSSLSATKMSYPTTYPQPSSLQAKAEKEYDQNLEALINFNVFEAFERAVQARVLTEIKKLLPTHILKVVANYVKPRLNTFVLEQLYETLYKSITLDHDALNAQDAEPSFHKRYHDNQDPPNNREGENWKKLNTPAIQPLDPEDKYVLNHPNPEWFPKKSGLANAKRRTTWFNLLLKSDIDQNENHILGPSTVTIVKKIKAIFQKDGLTIADLEVRKYDDKEYEFSYADLPRLSLNDVEDVRVVIQNRVEDIQLRVESYQQTLNLTKPMMFFEGIDQRIPFTVSGTHKGVVYLNQHNIKSFMKLSELKKFCDGTLIKIRENLVDMVKRNKMGTGSKQLKGRDWTDMDV